MKIQSSFLWLFVAALMILGLTYLMSAVVGMPGWISYLIAVNLVTLVINWLDKLLSYNPKSARVSSLVLALLALAGGSPAAMLGIYAIGNRSGRPHIGFQLLVWLILIVQLSIGFCYVTGPSQACPGPLATLGGG